MQKVAITSRSRASAHSRTYSLTQSTQSSRNWIPWGIAASLAMVAVFSLFVLNLMRTIERQNESLVASETEKHELQTQLVKLANEVERKDEQLKVLSAKTVHILVMDGMKANPVSYGKIIWDPEKKTAILQVANMPPVPSGKDYQLWVIKDKKPISAGVFAVNDTKSNFFMIEDLAVTNPREIAAFAVTLEPKGGMPAPTGEMYMLGSPQL